MRKAILEDPLLIARKPAAKPFACKALRQPDNKFPAGAMPAGIIMINRSRLLLESAQGNTVLPVSVTAQAEEVDQSLAVQLKNASIDEIGLKFTGNMNIASFAPLKLNANAIKGTLNPSTVRDFLVKFGYLNNKTAANIPSIKNLAFGKMQLAIDTASGSINLSADNINVDQMGFQKVVIKLTKGGDFSVHCSKGIVDLRSAYGWLQQNPKGEKTLAGILSHANLKVLTAQGLVLHLVDANGAEQNFTIGQLNTKITVKHSRPSIRVEKLKFNSSRGGKGSIRAVISIPVNLKQISLQSSIKALDIFGTTLDLHINKAGQPKSAFNLALTSPSSKIAATGVAYIPGRDKSDLDVRLTSLHIAGSTAKSRQQPLQAKNKTALEQHFNLSAVKNRTFSATGFIKNCQIENFTSLQDVKLQLKSEHNKTMLHGSMRIGGINLIVAAVTSQPHQLITSVDIRGSDVDLTSVIACFSRELPAYLTGRLYVSGSFSAAGNTLQSIINTAKGSVTVTLSRPEVLRLSGLDPRLSFFLDILRAAGISSDQEDSITFRRGVISANQEKGRIVIDSFSLIGPLLSARGTGEFTIKGRHLKLSGNVKTALGVTTDLNIDRILTKKET